MKYIYVLIILYTFRVDLLAQDMNVVDSLMLVIRSSTDTTSAYTMAYLSNYYRLHGKFDEGVKYAEAAISQSQRMHYKKGLIVGHYSLAMNLYELERLEESLNHHVIALNLRKEINAKVGIGLSHSNIALVHLKKSNFNDAIEHFQKAIEVFEKTNEKEELARTKKNAGIALELQGNFDEALEYFKQALVLYNALQSKRDIATMYNKIAINRYYTYNYEESYQAFKDEIALRKELKDLQSEAFAYNNISNLFREQGNYTEAIKYMNNSIQILEKIDATHYVAMSYSGLGAIYSSQGNYNKALEWFFKGMKIFDNLQDEFSQFDIQHNIGINYYFAKDYPNAMKWGKIALENYSKANNKSGIADAHINIGLIHQAMGNYEDALQYLSIAATMQEELNNKRGISLTLNNIGNVFIDLGLYEKAIEKLKPSLAMMYSLGDQEGIANVNNNLGKAYLKLGNYEEARKYLIEGIATAHKIGSKTRIVEGYETLTRLDSTTGNFKEAFYHLHQLRLYHDSIFNETSQKQLFELQEEYESEKKDREISELEKEKMIAQLRLTANEENLFRIRAEKDRLGAENLLQINQLELLEKGKELQELKLKESEKLRIANETKSAYELNLLNKESALQKVTISKQKQSKNYLLGSMGLVTILSLIVYNNHRTRQKLKLQTLRNKIASDLHDDVGSTLSSIAIFSEIAKQQSNEVIPMLDTIGESSRNMLDAMADIVWTINPENDQFEKIILRMRSFAYQLLGAKQIDFQFDVSDDVANIKLPMEVRKNLYLIFKEATNNMVKYSQADKAQFSIKEENKHLSLLIRDNGKGFDVKNRTEGNGLKNMHKRAEEIGARLHIESRLNEGTTIQLKIAV